MSRGSIDVDDLLNELEDDTPFSPPPKPKEPSRPQPVSSSRSPKDKESLDDLLDDLDLDSPPRTNLPTPQERSVPIKEEPTERSSGISTNSKCYPLYIGGAKDEQGVSPGRACNQLRCTKCDFDVMRIEGVEWDASVDYLFFRNFYPDASKLKQKTRPRPGSASYACQCSWRSASELTALIKGPDMRWVCAGHKVTFSTYPCKVDSKVSPTPPGENSLLVPSY